jgi:putative tricarboxylic transport membrane protein
MKILEKNANRYFGLFFIVLGLSIAAFTPSQVIGFLSTDFGPGMVFIIIAISLISLGLVLICQSRKDNNKYYEIADIKGTFVIFLLIVFYIIIMNVFGFIISSFIFLNFMIYYLGNKKILLNIFISTIFVVIIYFIFINMNVLLPSGIFF